MKIIVHEREDVLMLRANHSQLEFTVWRPGFKLLRGDRVVLQSGPGWGDPVSTLSLRNVSEAQVILTYNRGTHGLGRLIITLLEDGWRFQWDQPTRDTFDLASGIHWYGQGELIHQIWPLERASLWEAPFITWDNGPTGLSCIQSPSWITATGVALLVESPTDQLRVGLNAPPAHFAPPEWNLFNAQAPADSRPPLAMPGSSGLLTLCDPTAPLSYSLLVDADAVTVYRRLIDHVDKPARIPPEGLLRAPIWTTWARYKTEIDQDSVLRFAAEIREHRFPGGTLEIDDRWQRDYGDTALDPARFPDPAGMVGRLNDMGFAVTMWIIPFMAPASANTQYAARNGFLVRNQNGSPYEVLWWQGYSYLLDVTNPAALAWWAERLSVLKQEVGLAGFKFDAGEAAYLPADGVTYQPISRNEYSTRWAAFGALHFPYCEARCGWLGQQNGILYRQWDKFSTWGLDNGLASVITTALSLSMCGYPFILPDMVGGNAYGDVTADKELLIRWTQASAPMLALQFSLAPWDYDAETVEICRRFADLHVELADDRIAAAYQAAETGDPVIRPVFWFSPRDSEAQRIGNQYMLGEKYLVAPVVKQGAIQRDIYLPAGNWRDYWTGEQYTGGRWLRDFPAPLDTLPLFVRG